MNPGYIAAYLQRVERGDVPNREEFLAGHADIVPVLSSFFANRDAFQQMVGERASDSKPPGNSSGNSPSSVSDCHAATHIVSERGFPAAI
jgi:hypothetical protein